MGSTLTVSRMLVLGHHRAPTLAVSRAWVVGSTLTVSRAWVVGSTLAVSRAWVVGSTLTVSRMLVLGRGFDSGCI